MYRAALDNVAKSLDRNAEELKAVKTEFKVEQAHSKEMAKGLNEAGKLATSLKKLYSKEEGELKGMQKTIENQQKTLNKQQALSQDTRETYLVFLEQQQKELGYAIREAAERLRSISEMETQIQNRKTDLQNYEQLVSQKAAEIAKLENTLKQRQAAVKSEQKAAKSMQ